MNIIHLTNYDTKTPLRVNVDHITCYGASVMLKNCTAVYTMAGCSFMVTESPEEIDLEINEVNMRNTPQVTLHNHIEHKNPAQKQAEEYFRMQKIVKNTPTPRES